MHKKVKTCNMCFIMNLNQKYILKLLFLLSATYILAGIQMQLYFIPGPQPWGHSRQVSLIFFAPPQILLFPEKFVLNKYCNKSKNLAPLTVYFALQTSNPGHRLALCQLTLSNLWHSEVLTSESANVSDFSPHIISHLVNIEFVTPQLP